MDPLEPHVSQRKGRSSFATVGAAVALGRKLQKMATTIHEAKVSEGPVSNEIAPNNKASKSAKLEEQITNEKLCKLEKIFEDADEDGGGGLDIDEFRIAMRKTMGNVDDHELEILFMKVDTNCDGTVDWDEYLSYMLLEYKEKDQMTSLEQDKPFPKGIKDIDSSHRDDICRVTFLPTLLNKNGNRAETCHLHGRYISISKEGVLNFWTIDLQQLKTYHLLEKTQTIWVTDMVVMPNVNMVAISTTEREISVYDISASKFEKHYRISGLDHCALTMDYWFDERDLNRAVLVWGDTGGNVCSIVFSACTVGGIFGAYPGKHVHGQRIPFAELLKGHIRSIRAYRLIHVHDDWVIKIRYFPSLQSFISCSLSGTTAMYLGDFEQKKTCSYFKIRKGVLCFDYCPVSNVIVTGGVDHLVRVWNPYVTLKAIVVFKGHNKAVMHVIVNSKREQIISIGRDKTIRVFNLMDQSCAQIVSGSRISMGSHIISASYLNPGNQTLLIATNQIALFERKDEERVTEVRSHQFPICAALYNHLFDQVVSACQGSVVSVWDIETGQKVIQFTNAHKTIVNGEEVGIEISSMTFDPTARRLITGARDGSVKIWNFNNGGCLREMETPGNCEVTGVIAYRQRVIVAGWNKRITSYIDARESEDETATPWMRKHLDDILSLSLSPKMNAVATSSYDGDIILWSLETFHPMCRFNAYESASPLTLIKNTQQLKQMNNKRSEKESSNSALPKSNKSNAESKDKANRWQSAKAPHILRESPSQCSRSAPPNDRRDSKTTKVKPPSVEQIVFLTCRDNDEETATLMASGSEGYVRAWSAHHRGGLRGQFLAAHKAGESVSTLATDSRNKYLFTGDSSGHVKVWDISEYCISDAQLQKQQELKGDSPREKFTYKSFNESPYVQKLLSQKVKESPTPPTTSKPEETIKYPPTLSSFKAHVKAVTCIDFVEKTKLIITSSIDCSIRLWSLSGFHIGIFGEKPAWNLETVISKLSVVKKIPSDVKKVASAGTLRVLKGGMQPRWRMARNVILRWMVKTKAVDYPEQKDPEPSESDDSIEDLYEDGEILGKCYQPKVRHRIPDKLPPIKHNHNQVIVFSSLPFAELEPIKDVHPPQTITAIQERQAALMDAKTPKFKSFVTKQKTARALSKHLGSIRLKRRVKQLRALSRCQSLKKKLPSIGKKSTS